MAGLFFCLASAEGAGLLFCPAVIQPRANVYNGLYSVHAKLYHPRHKTAHRALRGLFQLFDVFCRCRVAGASSYTAPPAPRWSVSQRRNISSVCQIPAPRWTLYRPAQPPYYNKVYKARSCYGSMPASAAYRRPCQPGRSAPTVCRSLASADTIPAVQTRRTC